MTTPNPKAGAPGAHHLDTQHLDTQHLDTQHLDTRHLSGPEPPQASPEPRDEDHSRTGAVWVTATGALLVFAAAAVFVAVQWSNIPDEVRLAMLAGLTGATIIAGRSSRSILPATSGVLYHLGAFLIPVNVAAIGVHLHWSWPSLLLAEGACAATCFTLLNLTERSKVLSAAAWLGVVLAAGGAGAWAALPSALLLALVALVGEIAHRRRAPVAWALVAGFAPLLALAERSLSEVSGTAGTVTDVLGQLGLTGATPNRTGIATGLAAAIVLGHHAHRRRDLLFVVLAGAAAMLGIATTWVELDPGAGTTWVGITTCFLALEVAASMLAKDSFWGTPANVAARAAEWLAITVATFALSVGGVTLAIIESSAQPPLPGIAASAAPVVAGLVAALAWFVGDLRRRATDRTPAMLALLLGGGEVLATPGIVLSILAGVVLGTGSVVATAVTMAVLAAALVVSARPLGHVTAANLVAAAPLVAVTHGDVAAGCAAAGALTLVWAATLRVRIGTPAAAFESAMLTCVAMAALTEGALIASGDHGLFAATTAAIALAWIAALLLDTAADHPGGAFLGHIARAGTLVALLGWTGMTSTELAVIAGVLTAAFAADAARRDDPALAYAGMVTLPVAVTAAVTAAGGSVPVAGVAVASAGVPFTALALIAPVRWRTPAVAIAAVCAAIGLALSSPEPVAFANAILLVGGMVVVAGIVRRDPVMGFAGGVALTAGMWMQLSSAGIHDSDAYAAPVAALLLVAGVLARRRTGTGSWAAYGPAIALLGGTALVERLAGGPGMHAVLAGAVGVVAVGAGGSRRLSAPLLLGTALLLGVAGFESLTVTRGVPASVWLAIGGSILIAAGIAMERHETGPLETGRRVIDVVHHRFS